MGGQTRSEVGSVVTSQWREGALVANLPPPVLGPFGEIGRQTFDGRGNTEGAATLSGNGNINRVTFQGTYVVNPDCTGDGPSTSLRLGQL